MKKVKNNKKITLAIALVLGCLISLPAFAEEVNQKAELAFDLEGITVEAARPDWETKLSPGSVTVIRPDDYKGEQKTLPDLMRKVPGVHVREVNGKGQYTTVTVRGSTAAQVGVFIDGVLSNLGGDSVVDLSTIPVANVERIEVYRGYIPARFPGTYIGGVINIVTKKPEKADVSVELGKSSYGGKKGAIEVTAPLGSGSLMFGTSYESSDGDFKYKNYAAERKVPEIISKIKNIEGKISEFNTNKIENYKENLNLSADAVNTFVNDNNAWVNYLTDGSFANDYDRSKIKINPQLFIDSGVKEAYANEGSNWWNKAQEDWVNNSMDLSIRKLAEDQAIKNIINNINPETSNELANDRKNLEKEKKDLKDSSNPERRRKYNDYENVSSIIKWQDENWMIKGAWSKVDRHLPDSLWNGNPINAVIYNAIDLYDIYYYDSRRQKIDTKELLLQNRNNTGKLEWGWMLDYTDSEKSYRAEHIMDGTPDTSVPLREWSRYDSKKYNAQVDGSYKVSESNMLDFQMNYSYEKLNIFGSLMDQVLGDSNMASVLGQTRNRYEQDLLNVQVQDTITLDKKSSWYLTPSIKYNRSKITGYSDSKRFKAGEAHKHKWITPEDSQTDDKITWQLALKKEFSDNFTMRMTGGTYYRLLNMYEVAGDGAGILPAPNKDNFREASFPLPEEGEQFDISAIWNGKALGADSRTTLTYFHRDADNMLQLTRMGIDYWSYLNDIKGTTKGIELQSNFNWDKFDFDLQATYIKAAAQRRNSSPGIESGYVDIWQTYQPEWEGNARLTYRPTEEVSIFAEAHYTGKYYTSNQKNGNSEELAELSGRPVEDLLVFNGGLKLKMKNNWQLAFGCNDIFNKGPKLKIRSNTAYTVPGYINPEFPIQGRTYYVTAKYDF